MTGVPWLESPPESHDHNLRDSKPGSHGSSASMCPRLLLSQLLELNGFFGSKLSVIRRLR